MDEDNSARTIIQRLLGVTPERSLRATSSAHSADQVDAPFRGLRHSSRTSATNGKQAQVDPAPGLRRRPSLALAGALRDPYSLPRRMRLAPVLFVGVVIAGCGSHSTLQGRTAQVSGVYELCGGPSPGHCYVQKRGSVTVFGSQHAVVASLGLAKSGRFNVWLVPGRYTFVAATPSGIRGRRSMEAVAGNTTANIIVPIP